MKNDRAISLKAALDAADSIIERDTSGNNDVVKAMTAWKEYIKALPPAQPSATDTNVGGNLIDRQAAIDAFAPYAEYESNRTNAEWVRRINMVLSALPPAQPSLYGYDFRNLIVFADAVNKKGISDSEIEDFVRNARAAWEYAWEEFQRIQKEALDSIMRGDHHE